MGQLALRYLQGLHVAQLQQVREGEREKIEGGEREERRRNVKSIV